MTDRRRRPKVVPRAAADFVRQLKTRNWGNTLFILFFCDFKSFSHFCGFDAKIALVNYSPENED